MTIQKDISYYRTICGIPLSKNVHQVQVTKNWNENRMREAGFPQTKIWTMKCGNYNAVIEADEKNQKIIETELYIFND